MTDLTALESGSTAILNILSPYRRDFGELDSAISSGLYLKDVMNRSLKR